ncbi:hypothetical protein [Streptomyces megasporus]|uniref:hypothetical protein n=1 Tax=Streptomyces megasporus TaxID=44060 RepID=UPI0004E1EDA5|nr:hypothetical protein [Streptomyces megasporus]
MPIDSRPRRRSLLATGVTGAAALVLAGCSDGASEAVERERSSHAQRLRRRAARDSVDLLERYDRTIDAHPSLAGRLEPLRANVARHVTAFGGAAPRGSASPRTAADPGPAGTAVPADTGRALTALANAERATADARTRALLDAPPELARLLASVAAAGAAHAYLLTNGE